MGATGHIGGALLDLIAITYPTTLLTTLLRDERKAARLIAKYPQVIPKIGDLNSIELLESCSKNADVVISRLPNLICDTQSIIRPVHEKDARFRKSHRFMG